MKPKFAQQALFWTTGQAAEAWNVMTQASNHLLIKMLQTIKLCWKDTKESG